MCKIYDFLVVGTGFFGTVVAERLASIGKKVLIIDKRNHIGGNSYSEIDTETDIEFHKYGSHIFHTSHENVWDYINSFCQFNNYRHTVWITYKNKVYSMPINLHTINSYYNINLKPYEISEFLKKEIANKFIPNPVNLEEKAISLVGKPIYEAFIKGYTAKQWEKSPKELSADIISRLPIRHNYQNRYFNDQYEGIPECGYGQLFHKILSHPNISVRLNTDYFRNKENYNNIPMLFTGQIDQYFGYKFGKLEWRTIYFEAERYNIPEYQGCAVMNFAEEFIPYTRIHEFRYYHPERTCGNKTLIFKEYSKKATDMDDPYYPIPTFNNLNLYEKYYEESKKLKNVWFGGRLGMYKYFDMDDTIAEALNVFALISKSLNDESIK
jgi:UDP-galactopyranose mutase